MQIVEEVPKVSENQNSTQAQKSILILLPGSESIGTFSILALLLSIFNIINVVASNVNNNNNRNNINDNSGDLNSADNTESNANSNSETATQVMMVPPGVGKIYLKSWGKKFVKLK